MWWFLVRPAHEGGAAALLGDARPLRVAALGLAAARREVVAGRRRPARARASRRPRSTCSSRRRVTRRALVAAKLLRAQLLILVNTVVWSVILRGEGLQLAAWRRALGALGALLHAATCTASAPRSRRPSVGAPRRARDAGGRRSRSLVVARRRRARSCWSLAQAAPRSPRVDVRPGRLRAACSAASSTPRRPRAVLAPFRVAAHARARGRPARRGRARSAPRSCCSRCTRSGCCAPTSRSRTRRSRRRSARAARRDGARAPARPAPPRRCRRAVARAAARRRTLPLAPTARPRVAILWKNASRALRAGTLVRQLGAARRARRRARSLLRAARRAAWPRSRSSSRACGAGCSSSPARSGCASTCGRTSRTSPCCAPGRSRGRDIVAARDRVVDGARSPRFQLALLAACSSSASSAAVAPLSPATALALASRPRSRCPGVNAAGLTVQNARRAALPRLGAARRRPARRRGDGAEPAVDRRVARRRSRVLLAVPAAARRRRRLPAARVVERLGLRPRRPARHRSRRRSSSCPSSAGWAASSSARSPTVFDGACERRMSTAHVESACHLRLSARYAAAQPREKQCDAHDPSSQIRHLGYRHETEVGCVVDVRAQLGERRPRDAEVARLLRARRFSVPLRHRRVHRSRRAARLIPQRPALDRGHAPPSPQTARANLRAARYASNRSSDGSTTRICSPMLHATRARPCARTRRTQASHLERM